MYYILRLCTKDSSSLGACCCHNQYHDITAMLLTPPWGRLYRKHDVIHKTGSSNVLLNFGHRQRVQNIVKLGPVVPETDRQTDTRLHPSQYRASPARRSNIEHNEEAVQMTVSLPETMARDSGECPLVISEVSALWSSSSFIISTTSLSASSTSTLPRQHDTFIHSFVHLLAT